MALRAANLKECQRILDRAARRLLAEDHPAVVKREERRQK